MSDNDIDVAPGFFMLAEPPPPMDTALAPRVLPPNFGDYAPEDWDWDEQGQPFERVDAARVRLWQLRKVLREERIDGGCDTPHGRVDTDKASRDAIDSLCLASEAVFPVTFTREDNTTVALTMAEMLEVKLAVDLHVQAERDAAAAVRAALDDPAITTLAALYAVPLD